MREDWIDRWKGLLIALVVLGHAVGVASHFAHDATKELLDYVFKVIYCFHMPAFFCVVGYVWRMKADEGWMSFCRKKFLRLMVPYLVFAVLSGAVYYLTSGAFRAAVHGATDAYYARMSEMPTVGGLILSIVHAGGWPGNGVFRGNSVLWFLPAMFTVCVMYRSLDQLLAGMWSQLVLAMVFLVGSFYVPRGLPWGLSRASYFLPFVIVGRWIFPKLMDWRGWRNWMIPFLCTAYFVVCLVTPNAYYLNTHPAWRIVFFMIAVFGSWVSALVVRKIRFGILARFGLASLGIMLIHKYAILVVGMKVSFVRSLYANSEFVAALTTVLVSLFALFVSFGVTNALERYFPKFLGGGWK